MTLLSFLLTWFVLGAMFGWMFGSVAALGGPDEECTTNKEERDRD